MEFTNAFNTGFIFNSSSIISFDTGILISIIPVVLFVSSGFSTGVIMSKLRLTQTVFSRDMVYGNLVLCFIFISGFIVSGVLLSEAQLFFTIFTYLLIILSLISIIFVFELIYSSGKKAYQKSRSLNEIFFIAGICIVSISVFYHILLINYHTIFTEYDALYLYLPIAKSILLSDGLSQDFYTGSDIVVRSPPLIQSLDAWIMHSFESSSLRMFPVYFIILGSFSVYLFAYNITGDKIRSTMATSIFLITPAILVISSRFSLQQDLAFIFLITVLFFSLTQIVLKKNFSRVDLVVFVIALSILPIAREIGLILSLSVFVILAGTRYSKNFSARVMFSIISFLPLYALTAYDLYSNKGFTNMIFLRFVLLALSSSVIFLILSRLQSTYTFSLLHKVKYLLPVSVPLTFILLNFMLFNGPYPAFAMSGKFNESLELYREIFSISDPVQMSLAEASGSLPKMHVLFVSLALGTTFIFFKMKGFGSLIAGISKNNLFGIILIILVILLVIWSYLLGSDFERSDIRHVSYFVPLLSVIIVAGMSGVQDYRRIYYLSVIVFSMYYFLYFNSQVVIINNNFEGLWIDPQLRPLMSVFDLFVAGIIASPLVVFSFIEKKKKSSLRKSMPILYEAGDYVQYNNCSRSRYAIVALAILVIVVLYAFIIGFSPEFASIIFASAQQDVVPHPGWEMGVFEVITFLNSAEDGNVLSFRAPAIPYFTNRTNFDLYSVHIFPSIAEILIAQNASIIYDELERIGIKYIVLPNENSPLHSAVIKLKNKTNFIDIIETDNRFEKVVLKNFNIYKFNSSPLLDFIDEKYRWESHNTGVDLIINNNNNNNNASLSIKTTIINSKKTFNRASTIINYPINQTVPAILSLEYSTSSQLGGNAQYVFEFRDPVTDTFLWSTDLNETQPGMTLKGTYILPEKVNNRDLEVRVYIITQSEGTFEINLKKAQIILP